ncbi:MAG: hypothetical protein JSU68_10915 [Phycisphaerales bacterium]|nr:MAG: hypothetical protein JSU68_10915 [Phycisphaerales bacterium]
MNLGKWRSAGPQTGFGASVLVLTCLLAGPSALGAPVLVQNDNFVEGDNIVIGDFSPGEEAAAWLTSPCDGSIVEVHVGWYEGTLGNPPSLEEAIHIRAAAGFPNPGTELETLVGPLMTPGGINIFTHLDQEQTIPVDVPVSAGQTFVVALEFANQTDVGNGGPSIVRDRDGCQASRNALFVLPGVWLDWCSFPTEYPPKGDLVIRVMVDCQDPTGACCDANGFCSDGVEADQCQATGETFYEEQLCTEVTCPQPKGACCDGLGGCLYVDQSFCEGTLDWVYGGNGTNCDDPVCDLGACCLSDGTCQDVIELGCGDLGGTYQGAGTDCDTADCPQPLGACCVGDTCAPDQTESDCDSVSGTWLGALTDCGPPDPCAGPDCTCGDVDNNGAPVGLSDFATFAVCYGLSAPAPDCGAEELYCSDLDGDGSVTLGDFATFAVLFGITTSNTPPNCN